MSSFSIQITAARGAHVAVNALEVATRARIDKILRGSGTLAQAEKTVSDAYRSSVALAQAQARGQTEIPDWRLRAEGGSTPYLTALLKDVRRNWAEYGASVKDDTAQRRLALRVKHSAGVAVQRGYTDALVSSYIQMADLGVVVHKVWLANFVDHVPCPQCYELSGQEVGLNEAFSTKGYRDPYIDLLGPPLHPQCMCKITLVTEALENSGEAITPALPPKPSTASSDPQKAPAQRLSKPARPAKKPEMTATTVRAMAAPVFGAFVTFLGRILKMLRGR